MILNTTYNSKTLANRLSSQSLAAIKQAEDIADDMEHDFNALSKSTIYSNEEKEAAFVLPNSAANAQAKLLQESIDDLDKNIDTEFNPKDATEGSMWMDYVKDRIKQTIQQKTNRQGQVVGEINMVDAIKTAVRASGSAMPAKVALALPLDVSYLRMDADREQIRLMIQTEEDISKSEKLKVELHAVLANANALNNKHTELKRQLVAPVRYQTIGNVHLSA